MATIEIQADANKAIALLNAFQGLDGRDQKQNVNGNDAVFRVPYVLGPKLRMLIVRNIIECRKFVENFDEVKISILKEIWPDAPDVRMGSIPIKDFPEGGWKKFSDAIAVATENHKDTIKLFTLDESLIISNDDNDFPMSALETLLNEGVIVTEEKSTKKKK